MRKAQIQGQVFIYILMIVIVALILVYGYKAISDFGKKSQQIDLIESKGMVKNAIEQNMGYKVIKKVEIMLPASYTHICFASSKLVRGDNVGWSSLVSNPTLADPDLSGKLAIIQDSVESHYNRDMFYFPDGTESMDVGEIDVEDFFKCFKKTNGIVVLRLEGQGDSVKISEWQR